jgi:RHS repeat-associated protein
MIKTIPPLVSDFTKYQTNKKPPTKTNAGGCKNSKIVTNIDQKLFNSEIMNKTTTHPAPNPPPQQHNPAALRLSFGYTYFGARYYNSELSVWLSVDPLADKYPSLSPYMYTAGNPVMLVDSDGKDWAEVEVTKENKTTKEIKWFENKEAFEKSGEKGEYLGEVAVIFKGSEDEKLGNDGTLTGEGAKAAEVTIYGKNGKDDIKTYDGLTITSDPTKSVPIAEGDYKAFYQDMNDSPYGEKGAKRRGFKTALTYRISTIEGNLTLPTKDGKKNPANNNKPNKTEIFLHRTNWGGSAKLSSTGCLNIDGRYWRSVEKQLGKSKSIFIRVTR